VVGVPRRRKSEDIDYRLGRLARKRVEAQAKAAESLPGPPLKKQGAEISDLMSRLSSQAKGQQFTQEVHLKPGDPGYGKPQEGTKTAARGRNAHQHISGEIVELCEVISLHGRMTGQTDGDVCGILFGDLFQLYTRISNKVVGLLLRARKYKLVEFEGETLFQGRDEETPIYLIRSIAQVKEVFRSGQNPATFQWGKIGATEDS